MPTPPLAHDLAALPALLEQTRVAALAYLSELEQRPPATAYTPGPLPALPEMGAGASATLDHFLARFGDALPASNGPRFWGFVTGGTTPAALMGDWLTAAYDLNLSSAANSAAPDIEREALSLFGQLLGLPAEMAGVFVTGATMANVAGLAIGREWAGQQQGISVAQAGLHAVPPIPVLTAEAHSSTFKALALLGMGRANVTLLPVLAGNREAVDVAALATALAALNGTPAIVVANAGTVNTVDFDDLAAIAALRDRFPFWLHVDAAFGGFAACSPAYRPLVAGIELADSLTVDAHKWLNVPYDAAVLFTRHRDLQVAVFQNSAAYLGALAEPYDFVHLAPENSRRLRALPTWFTLHAYGRAGYQAIVEQCCALAHALGARIAASPDFRLLAPVRMNVVCFTLAGEPTAGEVSAFLARLREDGHVFLTPTRYQGEPGIRAAFSNWRTGEADVESAWAAMQRVRKA